MSTASNPKFDDRTQELWDLLHHVETDDLKLCAERLSQLTEAIATAALHGYVENAELVPTAETSLADARVVARLMEHTAAELERLDSTFTAIRRNVDELLTLAEAR